MKKFFNMLFFIIICFPMVFSGLVSEEFIKNYVLNIDSIKNIASYGKDMADNFSTKTIFMNLYADFNYKFFKEAIAENVYIGKEDEFFYAGDNMEKDVAGQYLVTKEKLNEICEAQQEISDELKKLGSRYLIVVCPDKSAVYRDKLFSRYINAGRLYPSRQEQIINALRENTDVEILDLTEALIDESKNNRVYMKTDSHWNYNGSFRAYQEIIKYLRQYYPQLPMMEKDDYNIEYVNTTGQNLSSLAYLSDNINEEDIPIYTPKIQSEAEDLKASYPEQSPIGETCGMIIKENDKNKDMPVLMMYADSFAGWHEKYTNYWNLNIFMQESFFKYIRYHYYGTPIDLKLVKIEEPDIVIREYVSSNLELLSEKCIGTDIYNLGDEILFTSGGNSSDYIKNGISVCEGDFTWSLGKETDIYINLNEYFKNNLKLSVFLNMVYPGNNNVQNVELYVNDVLADNIILTPTDLYFDLEINSDLLISGMNKITLKYPDAVLVGDREIALAFEKIILSEY